MPSITTIATYNRIFSMTNSINRFISEASIAKTNIALSLSNAINSQMREGIGNNINVLA